MHSTLNHNGLMLLCQLALHGLSVNLYIFELGPPYIEITAVAVGLFLIKGSFLRKEQEPIFVNVKICIRCAINVKGKEASGSRKRGEYHVINRDWDSQFAASGVYRS